MYVEQTTLGGFVIWLPDLETYWAGTGKYSLTRPWRFLGIEWANRTIASETCGVAALVQEI